MKKLMTSYVLSMLGLKQVKEKRYSPSSRSEPQDAYIFHSKGDYYQYFIENGVAIEESNIEYVNLGIMLTILNGDVIALKGHCDLIIEKVSSNYGNNSQNGFIYQKQVVKK